VATPSDKALDTAFIMALEKILQSTEDPRQKEQLRRLLEEKRGGGKNQ
jgi:hypothetical protein